MNSKKNNLLKSDFLSSEERKEIIDQIINFFEEERGEEIGMIAAEDILDFFLQSMGEKIYKKGLKEARKIIKNWSDNLEMELNLLYQD